MNIDRYRIIIERKHARARCCCTVVNTIWGINSCGAYYFELDTFVCGACEIFPCVAHINNIWWSDEHIYITLFDFKWTPERPMQLSLLVSLLSCVESAHFPIRRRRRRRTLNWIKINLFYAGTWCVNFFD